MQPEFYVFARKNWTFSNLPYKTLSDIDLRGFDNVLLDDRIRNWKCLRVWWSYSQIHALYMGNLGNCFFKNALMEILTDCFIAGVQNNTIIAKSQ